MRIVIYISGHGLGHAVRAIEVMWALVRRRPDARIVVRTSAPAWLFRRSAPEQIELHEVAVDTGMVQVDSLQLDEERSAVEAARFYADFDRRADAEARLIRERAATVVVGDIPPLAFAAAARAAVPSVAIGNFTWDWIYHASPAVERLAPKVVPTIRDAYAQATAALRLPLHGGFDAMAPVTRDIPFIARRSRRERAAVRGILGVPSDRPAVLVSFGGYGADLPVEAVRRTAPLTILTPPREPEGLLYEDIVAASDVVVSKPGYGIVSDCVANGAALLYTSRGRFAEYDVFARDMPRYLRCRFISQEDLRAGRWADAVEALLAQTPPPERPRLDGADVAATQVLHLAG